MARSAVSVTVNQSLGGGAYDTAVAGFTSPSVAATAGDVAVAAVQALVGAVTTAQGLAEADATISGNPTALGLVEDIGTAFTALTDALTLAKAATVAAAAGAAGGEVIVDLDTTAVTSTNQLKAALASALQTLRGTSLLTP